jgi:putative membrane-bound dehydrogenase-like protein
MLIPLSATESSLADTNRLAYLDAFLDPYYVHRDFPKLVTPQWAGPDIEAVVVLAIDDMRDPAKYESFLRPILARLKQIDGRAALSIMTNSVDPADPQLERWLAEGLSIETHTIDHPCPCLASADFQKAKSTYDRCVDLMFQIPGNRPVAFRMPCCDSRNTPSPRFWSEIFHRTTPHGHFLSLDSSVFNVFTSADPQLPRELVKGEAGDERFRRYLPFPSFVNTIENYPYPYVIGRMSWQFPCVVPSDWQAQNIQRPGNPRTVEDWKAALDATVIKQGVFSLVFHPHGWIRNDQIVELIDYSATRYGPKVKFLTFREAQECLNRYLLDGQPLRSRDGGDNGVRLLDVDNDGFLDVVIGNDQTQTTRRWLPGQRQWAVTNFPTHISGRAASGESYEEGVRFASLPTMNDQALLLVRNETTSGAWRFDGHEWVADKRFLEGLEVNGQPLQTNDQGRDRGMRLRDVDRDGTLELIVANPDSRALLQWNELQGRWIPLACSLPSAALLVDQLGRDAGLRLVDLDGDTRDDIVFSNEHRYGAYLFTSIADGWARTLREGDCGQKGSIPMIANAGMNNGAWFHSRHLWVQNESTDRLPDGVDRLAFADMLEPEAQTADFPPAKSPEASLADISTRPGMTVELVAAEPLVSDPIAIDWGPDGRLWVVEMRDYPEGLDGQGKPGGRVRVLQDQDGDGRYDRSSVFLDELPYPTAVKAWRNGILVLAAPHLIYAEDRDGDDQADVRETLFRGFGTGNPQHLANGLRWGLDNWLYLANGDSGGVVTSLKSNQSVRIGGLDLRIRVDEGQLDALSGQTQYGRNRDDWGNWFGGNNSDPIWHYVLEDRYLRRNRTFVPIDVRKHISRERGAAPVFPTSRTLERFNDFEKANRFTSACSPMIYRDQLLGPEFYGNAFICEPVHNLVHRQIVSPDGVSFRGERAADEQNSEFLASKDNWFRPTMVRTGPDGALWIADMYRLVIEHPEWIPQRWQRRLNLRDGEGRGRIYRVYPAGSRPRQPARLDTMDTAGLVEMLGSPNGWQRDMAQQMILWRADRSAPAKAKLLEPMALASPLPLARLHALCTLDGLGMLREEVLLRALADEHPGIVRHAIELSEPMLGKHKGLAAAVLATQAHADMAIQLQLACSLGGWLSPEATSALAQLALKHHADPYIRTAVLSSLTKENVGHVFQQISADASQHDALVDLTLPLAEAVAALGDAETINEVFADLFSSETQDALGWRASAASAMLDALERRGMPPSQRLSEEARVALTQMKERARNILRDPQSSQANRQLALTLLGRPFFQAPDDASLIGRMLAAQYPPDVQLAAVEALARLSDPSTPAQLLAGWAAHSPQLRGRILDQLVGRPEWTQQLIDAIERGQVQPAHIDARRRQLLVGHDDPEVRRAAARLLEAHTTSSDRAETLQQYQDVLRTASDAVRGKTVFTKHCAACHQLDDVGTAVGVNLLTLTDRSAQSLLTSTLDPNRAVEDRYLDYLVRLADGRQLRGMIARETSNSIVLIDQEGKQLEILRDQIDELRSSGKSLMPEGLERDMSKQDLADVIAYVASRRPPPKQFPGNRPTVADVRDDGSIRLLAIYGRIYGPTIVFEQQYRNVGHWQSPDDYVVWSVEVPAAGTYQVVIDYACDNAAAGDAFVIEVAGQTIGGRVTGTGSWDEYDTRPVGDVSLPAGPLEVLMRGDGPIRSALLDLRAIRLHPKGR